MLQYKTVRAMTGMLRVVYALEYKVFAVTIHRLLLIAMPRITLSRALQLMLELNVV